MRSTPEHNRRKRNAVIIVSIAVIAVAVWIGAAFALSGGSGGEEGGSERAAGEQQAQVPETTTDQPSTSETNNPQQEGEERQAVSEEDDGPPPTHPDVPSQPSPPGDWRQGEAPEGGEPPVANNPDSGGQNPPVSDSSSEGSGEDSGNEDSGEAASGEGGQQQGFDPLGKNPEPGDLTETQSQRVKDTADRFITAAYGYTGSSREDYEQGIEQAALTHGLYRSPGGERIQEYAKAAGEDGITSAAVMDRFEITSTSTGRVEGVAYFEVGKSYNRYAELTGESTAFEQKLTLAPMQGSYRVIGAEVEQQRGGD